MEDKTAYKEKVCLEEECTEHWEELPSAVKAKTAAFVYCPFCANEMVTRCSGCGETIHDVGFQFCPWCGAKFEEKEEPPA